MRHLGDITKIHGDKIPPVDVITGGSPCQDLSVAGKRAGLDGERSGLFMEQIRIVKEMRNATGADVDIRLAKPRYMVWENVPGAFSSNKGKDFQAVLTEIIRIAQSNAPDVPMPKNAKWGGAGCLYDEMGRWSVAWRVHDAQFWGVPQRRKRIALVADFGGLSAAEILFVKKSLHWHSEPGEAQRQGTAERTGSCIDAAGRTYCLQGNGIDRADTARCNGRGWREDVSYTLNTIDRPAVVCLNDQGGSQMEVSENISGTLRAQQHGHQPLVFEPRSQDGVPRISDKDVSPTLNTMRGGQRQPCIVQRRTIDNRNDINKEHSC